MPLPPPKKTDQVFQLSLTELAFILVFLLLLLAGAIVMKLEKEAEAAQLQAENIRNEAQSARADRIASDKVYDEIRQILQSQNMADPDKVISELQKKAAEKAENQKLREKVEDLNSRLSAMKHIEKVLQKSKPEESGKNVQKEIESALTFKKAMEKATEKNVEPGQEQKAVQEIVQTQKALKEAGVDPSEVPKIVKTNKDLKGRNTWLIKKLNANGGRDFPPCWVDETTNRIQYLFRVTIKEDGLFIERAWPKAREAEALALPDIDRLLSGEIQPLQRFSANMQGIDQLCRENDCRHYVILQNEVEDLEEFNRHRFGVERFFYKYEVR